GPAAAIPADEGDGIGALSLAFDVGSEPTRLDDDLHAGRAAHRIVAREAVLNTRVGERCGKFNCVVAGLDCTLRYVWPCDERGVAEECHAPAAHHWRFEIADRLEERLCGCPHDLRKVRREQRLGIAPETRN